MLLGISFIAVFLIIFAVLYSFLTLDPKLEKSKKVKGRIRVVRQGGVGEAQPEESKAAPTSIFRDISVSDIPSLNLLLVRFRQITTLQKLIDQSGIRTKASMVFLLSGTLLVCGIAFLNILFGVTLPVTLVASAGLAAMPFLYILFKRRLRFRKFEAQFPQALDLLARALKAGYSLTNALEMASQELPNPVSLELKVIYNLQSLGWTLRQTLMNFVDRIPQPDVKLFVTATLIHKDIGGNLAEVLENAASVIRQRFVLRRQLRSMTAQARLSGYFMTGLPFVVIGILLVVAPEYINNLFQDPLGKTMLMVGAVMLTAGILLVRKFLQIKDI